MKKLHIQYNSPVVLSFALLSLAALLLGFVWFCAVTWAARLIVWAIDGGECYGG